MFLFRIKDTDDRDRCAYIEDNQPRFECNHYFGSVILHGTCYSTHTFPAYEDIETVLTENEYNALIEYNKILNDLGCGIEKGDDRYQKGIQAYEKVAHVFEKLRSDEADEFFDNIIEDEKTWCMNEYNLSSDEVNEIFDNYSDYQDRSIIGYVWNDYEEYGEEEAWSCGYLHDMENNPLKNYIDFEAFGEALADDRGDYVLSDGRIVMYNY